MIGSERSKIFSILKIIERDNDKYEIAKKHYKILLEELPIKDQVRYIIFDHTVCSNIIILNFLLSIFNIRISVFEFFLDNTMLRRHVSTTKTRSDVDGA